MIEAIFIEKHEGDPQTQEIEVELVAGKGIVGERHFGMDKGYVQNITFVEAEDIENFNQNYHQSIEGNATRRNVITRGVRLNDLVGKHFKIGEVMFYGVELCEPCKTLGSRLASNNITAPEVIKAWLHKGGLRANVMSNGFIKVGMKFENQ